MVPACIVARELDVKLVESLCISSYDHKNQRDAQILHRPEKAGDGKGWPFGKPLTIDKVYALIQDVPGVEYATELNLYPINMTDPIGQRLGKNEQVIQVPVNGVVVSYYHNVYLAK